jgi:cystathionine beta-lyase/cystathionine gamma-synthase
MAASRHRPTDKVAALGVVKGVHDMPSSFSAGFDSPSTNALHAGATGESPWGALVCPLVQSTTYVQNEIGATGGHAYSRVSNPSVDELERRLGALEDAPPSVCFSSGIAAETALFLALLRAGDHVVLGEAIYGGTVRLVREILSGLAIDASFVDASDTDAIRSAINPRTKLVFIETPSNPTLRLVDIAAIAQVTREVGVPLGVDNTFLTPVLQRPLELGADVCVYSTTKLIEGHSTALGGAITSRDTALLERIRFIRKSTGAIQSALHAWLTVRGIKTLPLRVRAQSENAAHVARWLEAHPFIERVHYPGLESFPQRALAQRQHAGLHGNVVSFEVRGGTDAGRRVLEGVRLCALVEHVGSVETLITHPATMTHADVPRAQRLATGVTDGLIRLSVGLEEPSDVIADLDRAIRAAHQERTPEGAEIERGTPCAANV